MPTRASAGPQNSAGSTGAITDARTGAISAHLGCLTSSVPRFRRDPPTLTEVHAHIERDEHGVPYNIRHRRMHHYARTMYWNEMVKEMSESEGGERIRQIDAENPALYVEWMELNAAERRTP